MKKTEVQISVNKSKTYITSVVVEHEDDACVNDICETATEYAINHPRELSWEMDCLSSSGIDGEDIEDDSFAEVVPIDATDFDTDVVLDADEDKDE